MSSKDRNFLTIQVNNPDGKVQTYRFVYKKQVPPIQSSCINYALQYLPEHKDKSLYINGKILEFNSEAYYREEWKPDIGIDICSLVIIAQLCFSSPHYKRGYNISIIHLINMFALYVMDLNPKISYRKYHHKIKIDAKLGIVKFQDTTITIPYDAEWKEILELFKTLST